MSATQSGRSGGRAAPSPVEDRCESAGDEEAAEGDTDLLGEVAFAGPTQLPPGPPLSRSPGRARTSHAAEARGDHAGDGAAEPDQGARRRLWRSRDGRRLGLEAQAAQSLDEERTWRDETEDHEPDPEPRAGTEEEGEVHHLSLSLWAARRRAGRCPRVTRSISHSPAAKKPRTTRSISWPAGVS